MQQIVRHDSCLYLCGVVERPGFAGRWDGVAVGECTVGRRLEAQSGSQWLLEEEEEEEEEVPCGGVSWGEEGAVERTKKRTVVQVDIERAQDRSLAAAIVAAVLCGQAASHCPAQGRKVGQETVSRPSGGLAAGQPRL